MTIYEIAHLTGFSIATVSRVINGHGNVRASTRARIQEIVERTGYTPNLIARDLTARKNRTIGLVLPGINSYFSPAVEAITRAITADNGHVLICSNPSGGWNEKDEVESFKLLLSKRVQGVIFFASRVTERHLEVFRTWPSEVALVTVNDQAPGMDVAAVLPDPEPGFRGLFAHLAASGHQKVAFIDGPLVNKNAEDRVALRNALLAEYGIQSRPEWVREGLFNLESGAQLAGQLLEQGGFNALVCANDFMAIGALQTLHARGRKVPAEIALVGYDDLDISSFTYPALSTVAQSSLDLGKAALDLVLEAWAGAEAFPRVVTLPSRYIPRGTS